MPRPHEYEHLSLLLLFRLIANKPVISWTSNAETKTVNRKYRKIYCLLVTAFAARINLTPSVEGIDD